MNPTHTVSQNSLSQMLRMGFKKNCNNTYWNALSVFKLRCEIVSHVTFKLKALVGPNRTASEIRWEEISSSILSWIFSLDVQKIWEDRFDRFTCSPNAEARVSMECYPLPHTLRPWDLRAETGRSVLMDAQFSQWRTADDTSQHDVRHFTRSM